MKKQDLLWTLALLAVVFILVYPDSHELFVKATTDHPYLMGFVKVAILASMGELLSLRILRGRYVKPAGLVYRAIVWGFLGMCFVLVFELFGSGVAGAVKKGLLPAWQSGGQQKILLAFYTSLFMNLAFAPTFMAFHRVTDTFIDLGEGRLSRILKVKLSEVVGKIDWHGFVDFVVIKTIPIFWVPAHTITFLLPPEYRVLMAAFLSIFLGGILAFAKRKGTKRS